MKTYLLKLRQKYFRYEQLIVLGMFMIVAFLYYRDTFNYWFVADDAGAIFSSTLSLKDIFFTHIYSSIFYTPLVPLSFKPDVILFGITPLPYHIHNTVVLVLISFIVYRILRLHVDRISSLLPALIILLSTSSLMCLLFITLRQYLYAMLFSLLAIYLFLKYKPDLKNNPLIVLVILILSELSYMGKEQYMTLPFVLFILSEGAFKRRVIKTYPYFVVLAGHFLLRLFVLGGLGGYPGFVYSPVVYAKTVYESIFTESKVLFGYSWFIVFLSLPLLLRPRKFLQAMLIWLASLLVSFFVMNSYPELDTYRYWLIATVLFSFMVGFNINFIKNARLKAMYCFMITALFIIHSFETNKDVKESFQKEALMARTVTELITTGKYHDKLFLFPESRSNWLVTTYYMVTMSKAYYEIDRIKSSPPYFFPIELLSFYPEIMRSFNDIYEVKGDKVINITSSVNEKINFLEKTRTLSNEKPEIGLLKRNNEIEMTLKCRNAKELIAFRITNGKRQLNMKYDVAYLQRINLNAFGAKEVELLPLEKLSYDDKKWYFDGKPIPSDVSFITLTCLDDKGKYTPLSDIISFK